MVINIFILLLFETFETCGIATYHLKVPQARNKNETKSSQSYRLQWSNKIGDSLNTHNAHIAQASYSREVSLIMKDLSFFPNPLFPKLPFFKGRDEKNLITFLFKHQGDQNSREEWHIVCWTFLGDGGRGLSVDYSQSQLKLWTAVWGLAVTDWRD